MCVCVRLCVCVCVCTRARLSIYLSVCLPACLPVCLSVWLRGLIRLWGLAVSHISLLCGSELNPLACLVQPQVYRVGVLRERLRIMLVSGMNAGVNGYIRSRGIVNAQTLCRAWRRQKGTSKSTSPATACRGRSHEEWILVLLLLSPLSRAVHRQPKSGKVPSPNKRCLIDFMRPLGGLCCNCSLWGPQRAA